MSSLVIVGIICAVALLLLLIRTQAAIVFLALLAGGVLLRYVGADTVMAVSALMPHDNSSIISEVVKTAILVLPALTAAYMLKKTIHGFSVILNIFPAVGTGVVGFLLVIPLLNTVVSPSHLAKSTMWQTLIQYQNFIVATALALSIVIIGIDKRSYARARMRSHRSKKH